MNLDVLTIGQRQENCRQGSRSAVQSQTRITFFAKTIWLLFMLFLIVCIDLGAARASGPQII